MTSPSCPRCGVTLDPGAAFCTYCGTPVSPAPSPRSPSPPLPRAAPGLEGGLPLPESGSAPRRRSRALVLVAVLLGVLLVTGSGLYLVFSEPASVEVTALLIWAPDNVCDLGTNPGYYQGFNSTAGSSVSLTLRVPDYNVTSCTVRTLSTNTSGFALAGIGVPLTIPGNGRGALNVTVDLPGSGYTGPVNLVFD